MFGVFKSREQKAIDKFWKSDLGQRLVSHNEEYFGPGAVWGDFSPEGKQKSNGWLLERIFGVLDSPDHASAADADLALFACRPLVSPPIRAAHLDDVPDIADRMVAAVEQDDFRRLARAGLEGVSIFSRWGRLGLTLQEWFRCPLGIPIVQ